MTRLLYWEDEYLREFDATVTKLEPTRVALDQTAFYPEGGGQPTDQGTLATPARTYEVTRVYREAGEVWHELGTTDGLAVGARVHGVLDWPRRYALMRAHAAAHLFGSLVVGDTGCQITGNQKSIGRVRMDFSLDAVTPEQLRRWEARANEIIAQGLVIQTRIIPIEEALANPRLSKLKMGLPPGLIEVRVVDLGFDATACGGTHVHDLREIGRVRVTGVESKGKGRKRVEFLVLDA
jgi:misacylated tRNA(Ala) deacylase